jgi:hypothetical protein
MNIIYKIETPVNVNIPYCGSVEDSHVITYLIKERNWFLRLFRKYKIKQVIPYIQNARIDDRYTNRLLKTIAHRDKQLVKMWADDNRRF